MSLNVISKDPDWDLPMKLDPDPMQIRKKTVRSESDPDPLPPLLNITFLPKSFIVKFKGKNCYKTVKFFTFLNCCYQKYKLKQVY